MKTLICFLMFVIILPFSGPAQEWQNICSPGVTLYENPSGLIGAFRFDSVLSIGNGDSIFYSYPAIRYKTPCPDTTHGSVMGQMVYRTAGGFFYFFNRDNDTLSINTTAPLNATWKFCNLPAGGYILAKVGSVISDSVLGMPDSVRIIGFQAYDQSGNPVSHLMNTKHFGLSKHYGLSEAADMYTLPGSFDACTLSGKTSLNLGISNLDARRVYDFNVGDEFHYRSRYRSGFGPGSYGEYSAKILKILGKEVYGNNDSIVYQAEVCINNKVYLHNAGSPIITLTHDTTDLIYRFTGMNANAQAVNMPGEYVPYSYYQDNAAKEIHRFTTGTNGRQIQIVLPYFYFVPKPSFCYIGQCCWPEESYMEGLGKTGSSSLNMIYYDLDYDSLWYYKKGTEIWGTPVAADCNALLTKVDQLSAPGSRISVSPNPVHDHLQVVVTESMNGSDFRFDILDLPGHVVFSTTFHETQVVISRPALPAGLYIWRVTGVNRVAAGKIILD